MRAKEDGLTPTLRLLRLRRSIAGGVDNTVLNAGSGGDTIASDDIAGVKYPRVKVDFGADGVATDVADAAAARFPVKVGEELPAGTQNIGDVDIASPKEDADTGAGVRNVIPVVLVKTAAAAPDMGTATDPLRIDPTGTTTQPVGDAAGSLTVDAPVGTPVAVRPSDGAAFYELPVGQAPQAALAARGVAIAGQLDDTAPATPAEDQASVVRITSGRALHVAQQGAIPAGANNIGDVDVASFAAGAITEVQGDIAHDSPVSTSQPVLLAARANANEPTAVADADVSHLWADLLGRLVVLIGHPSPEVPVTANGSAAGLSVIAAPGAGVRLYINKVAIHNRGAEQVISLREGAAGSIRYTGNFAADGGGAVLDFGSRGWQLPLNTALVADIAAASADINVLEYSIAA